MDHFGAFVTESSHHMSEYVPYFRTKQETIDRMTGIDYAGRMPTASYLEGWLQESREHAYPSDSVDESEWEIERSEEYAARIIHSLESGQMRRFNLNIRNDSDIIENLPSTACVEVPCLVDGTGIHPCTIGSLPSQLAALNRTNINVQGLTVQAALKNDRDALFQAVKLDPLTAAVLDLDEIHEMTEELIDANEDYLPKLV